MSYYDRALKCALFSLVLTVIGVAGCKSIGASSETASNTTHNGRQWTEPKSASSEMGASIGIAAMAAESTSDSDSTEETPAYCEGYYAAIAAYMKLFPGSAGDVQNNLKIAAWYRNQSERLETPERDQARQFALGSGKMQEDLIAGGKGGGTQIGSIMLGEMKACQERLISLLPDTTSCFDTMGNVVGPKPECVSGTPSVDIPPIEDQGSDAHLSATDRAREIGNRGVAELQKTHYLNAFTLFNKAIQLAPNATLYNDRAGVLIALGQPASAIGDCNNALRLDPRAPEVFNNRAFAYQKLGDLNRAVEDYSRAIALAPDRTSALAQLHQFDPNDSYNGRGYARYRLGDRQGACSDWKAACGLGDCGNYNKAEFCH